MAKLLQAFGFTLGHEDMGKDGLSCFAWAVEDDAPAWAPGPRPDLSDWTVIHVVRDPMLNIPALAQDVWSQLKWQTYEFLRRHLPNEPECGWDKGPPLAYACATYLHFNDAASRIADVRINVEDAPLQLAGFLNRCLPNILLPGKTINTRCSGNRQPMEYSEMGPSANRVQCMADRYGYTA